MFILLTFTFSKGQSSAFFRIRIFHHGPGYTRQYGHRRVVGDLDTNNATLTSQVGYKAGKSSIVRFRAWGVMDGNIRIKDENMVRTYAGNINNAQDSTVSGWAVGELRSGHAA